MACTSSDVEGHCFKALFSSKDFGKDWYYVTNYVHQFGWMRPKAGETRFPQGFPSDMAMLATVQSKKGGHQSFGAWDPEVDLVMSFDGFDSTRMLVPGGNLFIFTDKYLFVAKAAGLASRLVGKLAASQNACIHMR